MAYGAFLLNARGQGTSHAPGLTIREIRAVRLRDGFNSRFVRVYTNQGLTGTGEMSYTSLTEPVSLDAEGFLQVRTTPGIGVALNEEVVKERTDPEFHPL